MYAARAVRPLGEIKGHGTTFHGLLMQYHMWHPSLKEVWLSSWGDWRQFAELWLVATTYNVHCICCLCIPQSLGDTIPADGKRRLRLRVVHHQYSMLSDTWSLGGELMRPLKVSQRF